MTPFELSVARAARMRGLLVSANLDDAGYLPVLVDQLLAAYPDLSLAEAWEIVLTTREQKGFAS